MFVYNGTQLYYPERLARLEYSAQHPFAAAASATGQASASASASASARVRVRLVEVGVVEPQTDAHRMLLNVCLRAAEMRGLRLTPLGAGRGVFDLDRRRVVDERNRYETRTRAVVRCCSCFLPVLVDT